MADVMGMTLVMSWVVGSRDETLSRDVVGHVNKIGSRASEVGHMTSRVSHMTETICCHFFFLRPGQGPDYIDLVFLNSRHLACNLSDLMIMDVIISLATVLLQG